MLPAIRATHAALVLALAFASVGVARAEDPVAQPVTALDQLPQDQKVSDTVIQLAGWVVASRDSEGYPFAIMDKGAAQSAEAANQSAQQANQRLDSLESRVQKLETAPPRKPRG